MNIFSEIFAIKELVDNPPILLDIGASGELNKKWKHIAEYSICIAFDADEREMDYVVKEDSNFKKLYVFNKIVTAEERKESDFYLTKSPYCSSLLKPDQEGLNDWFNKELFKVTEIKKIPTITLQHALNELNMERIDWFKTDAQGIDLRLFKSLGSELILKTLVAEFEPGILNAYQGEDKLHDVMSFMEKNPFWMSTCTIKGTQRVNRELLNEQLDNYEQYIYSQTMGISPGWAEVCYLNRFKDDSFNKRDYLLMWVFSVIEEQYGFSLEIARKGYHKYQDQIFVALEDESWKLIKVLFGNHRAYKFYASGDLFTYNDEDFIHRIKTVGEKEIVIFGAGGLGNKVLDVLSQREIAVKMFIDNNPQKLGSVHQGLPVGNLASIQPGMFVIVASTWYEEIADQLERHGLEKGKDFMIVLDKFK